MSQTISIVSKPIISQDVSWRRDGEKEQLIVLSKEGLPLPMILNISSARIFSLCTGENSLEEIAQKICDEFSVEDFSMVLEDVKRQVDEFLNKGIVEI